MSDVSIIFRLTHLYDVHTGVSGHPKQQKRIKAAAAVKLRVKQPPEASQKQILQRFRSFGKAARILLLKT